MFHKGILLGLAAALSGLCHGAELNPSGLIDFGGGSAGVPVLGFLKLPASARGIGMGAASLTTDEEASMIQANPALLALAADYYYSVSHAEILGEFRHENLAFTWPTPSYGNFGGSANILAATSFEDARDIDEIPANPTAYDIALGLSYAKSLWEDRVSAGGRLDLIRSKVDEAEATGYALNAGLIFLLVSDLRIALTLNNLSHGIRYDASSDSPVEPLPLGVGVEVGKPLLDSRWSAHVGAVQGNEGIAHFYAGLEWRLIKYLMVRAGYEGSSQDRELGAWSGLSTGLGIKYDRFTFDYGYKSLGPLGDYHAFTLNYSRKSKFRDRDEILLERALGKYHQGRYKSALGLARAAIAANPYNFKAQALAQKLQLELDREDGLAVTIAYTANTDGRLSSEWRDGRPVGGLARRKTKLIELKGAYENVLALDAGNLLSPASGSDKDKYVFGAYAQMPYDAVNMGPRESGLGERLDPRLPFLASQDPIGGGRSGILTEKILKLKHGAEVLVLGAMSPKWPEGAAVGPVDLEGIQEAVRRRAGEPKNGRIMVLLLHGNLKEAHEIAGKILDLDVIILSGESQALGSPMKSGKTLICSPGRGGTHLGELTLLIDKDGHRTSFRHFLVPLDGSIPEDPQLKKFLEPVTVDPNAFNMDEYDDDYQAQVIAYIRSKEPSAGGDLFLRDLRTGNDYLVPAPGLLCSRPILGYGKNRVAFAGEDGSGAREVYGFEPGINRLDTLTRLGGRAGDMRWILRNNAVLAVYEAGGKSDLYRIDPWSREVRDLTKGRFGAVMGFDATKSGERLAVNAWDGKASTLWITNLELESPLAIASDRLFPGSPRFNPQGDRLAFLAFTEGDSLAAPSPAKKDPAKRAAGTAPIGELRIFDFTTKAFLTGTRQSRVRSFSWSADGKRIYYSAGVNLGDINAFHLDSLTLNKVTAPQATPRNEENPVPKVLGGVDGMLFEATAAGARKILWMDLRTRKDTVLIDSAGWNSLK
ncbi:MAG: hypothetical protein JWP91_1471 [Fibrobacteres bacterium]|nr:hypothetical protein [Fibrobacterota bacterium]